MPKKEIPSNLLLSEEIEDEETIEGQIELEADLQNSSLTIVSQSHLVISSEEISEDIQILDERWIKYLKFQEKIRAIIRSNDKNKDAIIEDIVEATIQVGKSPSYLNFLLIPITFIPKHFKRKKLKRVIENILEKVFDVSLGYTVDYPDLKMTCNHIGGQEYFRSQDHRAIYEAIIQKLKQGPIRDECIKSGLVRYIDEKISDINDNYLKFRMEHI